MARSEAASPAADGGDGPTVALVDDGERVVEADGAPRATVTASFRCASGERWTGEWPGVPLDWLLERAPGGEAATHLRVHGPDGHVAYVALADAVGGVLATERGDGDGRLPPAARPRVVAPGVVGARTVKSVRRLELVEFAPGEDIEDHEALEPVDRARPSYRSVT